MTKVARRPSLLLATVVGALVLLVLARAAGAVPTLGLPGSIVAEATDASGAVVTYRQPRPMSRPARCRSPATGPAAVRPRGR